eukprot:scaffold15919_cov90-Cyclotella_meneghiniana.AAC.3
MMTKQQQQLRLAVLANVYFMQTYQEADRIGPMSLKDEKFDHKLTNGFFFEDEMCLKYRGQDLATARNYCCLLLTSPQFPRRSHLNQRDTGNISSSSQDGEGKAKGTTTQAALCEGVKG